MSMQALPLRFSLEETIETKTLALIMETRVLESPHSPTLFGGIRYYFKEQFAVYAEVGYGLGYLNGGIVYRFNYQFLLKQSGLNEL
jgi:hypothetical protein